MRKDDELVCLKNIYNLLGDILFEEGKIYKVLEVDEDQIYLNHILYANEYNCFSINWVLKNFKPL